MAINELYMKLLNENKALKEELEKYRTKDKVKRGDIIRIKQEMLETGNIQSFNRPYLVVSNDIGNYHSKICLCVPLTSQNKKPFQPTHLRCSYHQSVVLCEQIHTINQENVSKICHHLSDEEMTEVNKALKISIGVDKK